MALPTVNTNDFIGVIKISADTYRSRELQAYIDQNYENIVRKIVGAEATKDIVDNVLTTKWNDLFNGVYYQDKNNLKYYQTKGMTYVVMRYLYFLFVRDNFISTSTGKVKNKNENSTMLSGLSIAQLCVSKFNEAVNEVASLCVWIQNYDGFIGTITGFIDNGGGSYTINSNNTIYLQNSDTVTINGNDYIVSNVIDNVSFDITANTGLSFTGTYVYSPFESVVFTNLDYIIS